MNKKILLWFGDSPDNIALAWEIHQKYSVAGIVFERRKRSSLLNYSVSKLISKIVEKILFRKIDSAWFNMLKYYKGKVSSYPPVLTLFIENINSEEARQFSENIKPDLIMVSGTALIKKKMLSIKPPIGIINLHTGLSPYINGGPNCTNWCIAKNEFHLIGNTVMWINEGIDSGNIITTKVVQFNGNEDLNQIHRKVIEQAHQLYLSSIAVLFNAPQLCPNIEQDKIDIGVTYYNKMWGMKEKFQLIVNFKSFKKVVGSEEYKRKMERLKTVALPDIKT